MGNSKKKVIKNLLGNVVCIDESHEAGGECHGETDECSQFSIMSLANKNIEELSQLSSPLHTTGDKVLLRSLSS